MPETNIAPLTQTEIHAALFAQMVMQLSSTALILLGRAPHPVTGKTETDLESAQVFIDQLEMLAVKTRGNLGADEQHLLKQSQMTVQMAFVEAANARPAPPSASPPASPDAAVEDESKKKFSKSYGAQ